MSDEEIKVEEDDGMGTVVLMLGLYLIVLAFFILLNAISESSEVKTQKVSESLAEGFGFQLTGPVNMRDDVDIAVNPVFEIVSKEIEDVLESYLSVNNYKFVNNANKMVLTIDTKRIFSPGSIRIRPAMASFFEDISRVVTTKRPDSRLYAEVILEQNRTDIGTSRLNLSELAGRRASLFVRALIERNVDPSRISAGALYSESGASQVRIFFDVVIDDVAPDMVREINYREEGKKRIQVPKSYQGGW
jgi:hypothetical protein